MALTRVHLLATTRCNFISTDSTLSMCMRTVTCHINISCILFVPQIVGDAVGWGFVVRGSKPCHIQAVDPGGPAAAAGMKVRPGEMYGVPNTL